MAAYAEGPVGAGDRDSVIEGRAGGHQSGGGQRVRLVKLCYRAIDASCKAKVVCVDDKSGSHRDSLRT